MDMNESKSPVIDSCTTADGLKLNSVVLAEHLIPSNALVTGNPHPPHPGETWGIRGDL